MNGFERVARVGEIPPNSMYEVEIDGVPIVLTSVDGQICAFAALCSHLDGPLAQGGVENGVITCPYHGSQFDARTGAVLLGPANLPLRTYPVKVDRDDVFVSRE